jgi:hypothetical protein
MGGAVEILFLGAVVPELCLGSFLTPMVLRVCEIGTGLRGLMTLQTGTDVIFRFLDPWSGIGWFAVGTFRLSLTVQKLFDLPH